MLKIILVQGFCPLTINNLIIQFPDGFHLNIFYESMHYWANYFYSTANIYPRHQIFPVMQITTVCWISHKRLWPHFSMTVLEFSNVFTLLLVTPWHTVWSLRLLNALHYSEYTKNSYNITEYYFLIQHEQCCALRKIEGTPVLWIHKIQGAQHMICLKKLRFSSKLHAMNLFQNVHVN